MAVSYTHLDVYKRQLQLGSARLAGILVELSVLRNNIIVNNNIYYIMC